MDRYWFFTWRTYGTWLPGEPGFVGQYVTTAGERVSDNRPGSSTTPSMPPLAGYARSVRVAPAVYLSAGRAAAVAAQLHETAAFRGRQMDAIAVMANHVHIVFGVAGDPNPDDVLSDWKAYASRALNRLDVGASPDRRTGGRTRSVSDGVGHSGTGGRTRSVSDGVGHSGTGGRTRSVSDGVGHSGPIADAPDSPPRRRQRGTRPLWWAENGSTRILKALGSRTDAIRYVRDQENPLMVWLSEEARTLLEEAARRSAPGRPPG
jgi:hypothetical protein